MAFGYDGSIRIDTKINSNGFNKGISAMKTSLKGLAGAIGSVLAVAAIAFVSFGVKAAKTAGELQSALIGLQSIVEGQGRSFKQAQSFIQDYIKDGLVPLQSAVTAYKNLAMRGYSTEQIEKTMIALKNASTFGRSAALSMGEAVSSATEGLRNENSILVDNAGVTKNVSVMWKEYADSIGVGVQSLTKQQKIQAEVNGIMEETRFQTGDAAKAVNTYAGQLAILSFNFQQLKVAVGNAFIPIIKSILPGINSIIAALTQLANTFAQVTTLLFGDQSKAQEDLAASGNAAADANDHLAGATEDVGNSAEKTKKQIEGSLAGFDKLNKLADKTADSVGDISGGLDMTDKLPDEIVGGGELWGGVTISPDVQKAVEQFKAWLEEIKKTLLVLWEPFAISWENSGAKVIEAAKNALSGIFDLLKSIGIAFMQVWTNGTGVEVLNTIHSLVAGVLNIVSELAGRLREAWEANNNGVEIWQSILNIIQLVLDFLDRIVQSTITWAQGLNLEPIVTSFKNLLAVIEPFVSVVLDGLAWAYENVLLPLAGWFIEEAAPAGIDLLSAAINALTAILEVLQPLALWLWENFLKPLAAWTGEVFINAVNLITDALNGFAAWVRENQSVVQGITVVLGLFFAAWKGTELAAFVINAGGVVGILNKLATAIKAATIAKIADKIETIKMVGLYIGDFLKSIATSTINFVKNTASIIASTAAKVASTVAQYAMTTATLIWNGVVAIATTLTTAFGAALTFLTSPIGLVVLAIIALVAIVILLIKNWEAVSEFAVKAWETIKSAWSAAGEWFNKMVVEPIKEAFKAGINFMIGGVEGFINYFISGINAIIAALNLLHIDIPDWVPLIGGKSFGFNITPLQEVSLPRLANGAVIPPNRQFAAILGDQRSGTNIEAPLSTIEQAVTNAIQKNGYAGGPIDVHITFGGDLAQLVRMMNPVIERTKRISGQSFVKAGL